MLPAISHNVGQCVLWTLTSILMGMLMPNMLIARHQGTPAMGLDALAPGKGVAPKSLGPCVKMIDVRKDR
jgi:hypothetical protein